MARTLSSLSLLLWKNLLVRRRHPFFTFFEVFVPTSLFLLVAVFHHMAPPPEDGPQVLVTQYFRKEPLEDLVDNYKSMFGGVRLLYVPNNTFTSALMGRVHDKLGAREFVGLNKETDISDAYTTSDVTTGVLAPAFAVVFENCSQDSKNLSYKIRSNHAPWYTDKLYPRWGGNSLSFSSYVYFREGFLALQYALDTSYMEHLSKKKQLPFQVEMQQFPYPDVSSETYNPSAELLPTFLVLGFTIICSSVIKRVVEEKETGIRELMKMSGLRDWTIWLGWFFNSLLVCVVSVTVIVVLLTAPFTGPNNLILRTDATLLWTFLVAYSVSAVVFCLAFTALFSRSKLALSLGVALWLVWYQLSMAYLSNTKFLSWKIFSSINPNMALNWGFQVITRHEKEGSSLRWGNIHESPTGHEGEGMLSMLAVLGLLMLDVVIYGVITCYLETVVPGRYGLSKPWYFFCTPSYWKSKDTERGIEHTTTVNGNVKNFETPPDGLEVGIRLRDIRKLFHSFTGRTEKLAVQNVTLDIYKDQITALLGHNGAGKTTTMSILTGVLAPTSGSVFINGYNIIHNMAKVRESLGLCPQHNLHFKDLTVKEHLVFFGRMKGLTKQEANSEANDLLNKLNMREKRHNKPHELSGGMKRKVSLGIALVGASKVLILDEPTSGMDPEARREIWDLLLSMRGSRTILITTHFMEEADVLGDRIAIMDHGRVHCYGTSLFLKKLYGAGYHLKLMKQENCDIEQVTKLVHEHVPSSTLKSDLGSELWFNLPSDQTAQFPALFDALERDRDEIGVGGLSVAVTTLEEVFLRVGELANEEHETVSPSFTDVLLDYYDNEVPEMKKVIGCQLLLQQLRALLIKKIICMFKKWAYFVLVILTTIAMTALTVNVTLLEPPTKYDEPPRTFSMRDYTLSTVPYTVTAEVPRQLKNVYRRLVGFSPISKGTNLSDAILGIADQDLRGYLYNIVFGAEFQTEGEKNVIVANAMYASNVYHAAPLSLNVLNNALIKYLMNSHEYSITATNHPMKGAKREGAPSTIVSGNIVVVRWSNLIPLSLVIFLGAFMAFPLKERVSKAKQLQIMCGVSPVSYWLTCFLWDYLVYLLVCVIMVLTVYLFDTLDIFRQRVELGTFFLMLLLYGFSGIPYVYFFSFLKNTSTSGFFIFLIINLLIGTIMPIVVLLSESDGVKYAMLVFPQFCLVSGLASFSSLAVSNNKCKLIRETDRLSLCSNKMTLSPCCGTKTAADAILKLPYLQFAQKKNMHGIGLEVTFLALDSLIYMGIILMIEYGVVGKITEAVFKMLCPFRVTDVQLNEDVVKEQIRVNQQIRGSRKQGPSDEIPLRDREEEPDDVLLVDRMVKKYRRFAAVKGVSFGVKRGECFGLLGVNGAGKTTTFRMLTGDEVPTGGDAVLRGHSLKKHPREFLSQLGYCPQFDALNDCLTGREMLQLFAHLKGLPRGSIDQEVTRWINMLGLTEHATRLCGTYSGGNKRKLSTAMALIGDPPIVFLDEPTSGVDPVARRNLWNVLAQIQSTGQSIVLTSHSMEECEALCNRLAIMVNGQFVCMGGNQYLKKRFGQGFTVMIKLGIIKDDNDLLDVKNAMQLIFRRDCELKDEHKGLLHYRILNTRMSWKVLFIMMERLKVTIPSVEDYTISETTLEQVFLAFAKSQKDDV